MNNKSKSQKNAARKRWLRTVNSRSKRKRRRKLIQQLVSENGREVVYESRNYDITVNAPSNFSFASNRDRVLYYIAKLESARNRQKSLFVNLQNVSSIDLEAITLLLGIMAEFKSARIPFNGNFPKNKVAKVQLINSGFFAKLFTNPQGYSINAKGGIHTHGSKVYDAEATCEGLSRAMICVFGEKRRSQGARRVLQEAMKNTLEHAGPKKQRYWWLTFKEDYENHRLTVSLLDYGIGIFASLKIPSEDNPAYSWYEKNVELGISNRKILRKIMDGELKAISRTRLPKHGTGLPGMKTALSYGFISNLIVLSNDVIADVGAHQYHKLNSRFSGTFIQFTIDRTCQSFPYE